MENYSVQRLSALNIGHLASLYRTANNQIVPSDFLLKKYDTKKLGTSFIGFIAYSKQGLPIAYYGVIPMLLKLEGETILAAQGADTMTHPDFRKQGLFYLLARETFQLARENNIRFIFGFANQNSLPGAVKLQFQIMPSALQLFTIKTEAPPIGRLMTKSKILGKIYQTYLHFTLSGRQFFPATVFQSDGLNGVSHDQSFFEYKTYHKSYFVKLNKHFLWLKVDGSLKVGLVKFAEEPPQNFIKKIKRLAVVLGCREVIFITNKNSNLYKFLSQVIHPTDALPICFQNLTSGSVPFEKIEFEYGDIDIF